MHFTSQTTSDEGHAQQNWHAMLFRSDFFDTLKDYGRLPVQSFKEQLQLISELKDFKYAALPEGEQIE